MPHFFKSIIAFWMLFGVVLPATPSQAATFRYSFDVTETKLYFHDMLKIDMFDLGILPWEPGEAERVLVATHPLGQLHGKTGPVIIDAEANLSDRSLPALADSMTCVSGMLCDAGFDMSEGYLGTNSLWFVMGGMTMGLSASSMIGLDNGPRGISFGCEGSHPNCIVDIWNAQAEFKIANLRITELTPVPLPAGGGLLLAGLCAMGALRLRGRS